MRGSIVGRVGGAAAIIATLVGACAADGSAPARTFAPTPTATPTAMLTRTPTATRTPTITPTPAFSFHTPLLRETFDHARRLALRLGQSAHATYALADGGYTVHVSDPSFLAWSPLDGTFASSAISVDARLARGPANTAAGIIFRMQDENNFYLFHVSADQHYALVLLQNGVWKPIIDWTDAPQINGPGAVNHLRVEAAGARMRLYVNGTLLDEVSDDTFATGAVALAVHTFEAGDATVLFDNLLIKGL